MKHIEKIKLARRLRTKKELVDRIPIFETQGWESRKKSIRERVLRRQNKRVKK